MSSTSTAVRRLQMFGGPAFGALALGAFLWTMDWGGLAAVLGRVSWTWIGVATTVMLLDYAVHGRRFQVLLRDAAPQLDAATTWRATTILWAFNTLLPLRAGLVLRPFVVQRVTNLPYATVFSTVVAETVCDLFGIVIVLLTMIAVLPENLANEGPLMRVRGLGTWAGAGALVMLALVFLLSSPAARQLTAQFVRWVPSERARALLVQGFDQVIAGLVGVRNPFRLLEALALTLVVWGGWLVAIIATLRAFSLDVGLAGALFVETALTLSMMIPQAPGFLGVFQVVVEEALGLFGAPRGESEAVALLFWTLCFVPITLLGLFDAWRLGLRPGTAPAT